MPRSSLDLRARALARAARTFHALLFPACAFAILVLMAPLTAGPARAQLVINELLPDPAGSDGGHEYVELLNPGDQPVDLGGWQLQFANGADGPVWQTRWSGQAGQALPPRGRFLIVDRGWTASPPGDAEVALGLQNGPDAIRLTRAGVAVDVVGYGALTDPQLMETAPAPLAAGRATARRPDGRDTGDNAADFVTTGLTPGRENFARFLLTAVESLVEPPSLAAPGQAVAVAATLRNDGLETVPTARVRLAWGDDGVEATLDALAPGDARSFAWTLRPQGEGRRPLRVCVPVAAAETLVATLGAYQVGPGELQLQEVLAAPRAGQGEWFEVRADGTAAVALDAYEVRDEDGDWTALPALTLLPGDLAVVAQDSAALAAWLAAGAGGPAMPDGCGAPLRALAAWPSLNNTAPATRAWADRVYLADSTGTVIDHVTIVDAGGDGSGRSLERLGARLPGGAAAWALSLAAAGSTPGCPNSVAAPADSAAAGVGLAVVPAVADRAAGGAAVHLRFAVPDGADGWDLVVCDLDGRRVRDLGGDRLGPGPRAVFWDLRDDGGRAVAPGGYVAALRLAGAVAGRPAAARHLLVVR